MEESKKFGVCQKSAIRTFGLTSDSCYQCLGIVFEKDYHPKAPANFNNMITKYQ